MQKQITTEVSQWLEEAGQLVQRGEREKAHQISLRATGAAPDEPMAWYLRSQSAPSTEEQLMCLSRAYSLNPAFPAAWHELRSAVHGLLKQEPFLAYVYENEEFYQVRSGHDLLINVPKNRVFELPYLQKAPGLTEPAFRWLSLALLGLILGGVGAVVLAPVTVFQVLRLQATSPARGDRVRLWIVCILAVIIWLVSIPISWLLILRFYP